MFITIHIRCFLLLSSQNDAKIFQVLYVEVSDIKRLIETPQTTSTYTLSHFIISLFGYLMLYLF